VGDPVSRKRFEERFDEPELMNLAERAAVCKEIRADCDMVNDCWVYKHLNAEGYGVRRIAGASRSVGRFMLAAKSGLDMRSVRYNVEACHNKLICRHQGCCNPRHLYWGTEKQNRADREKDKWAAIHLDFYCNVELTRLALKVILTRLLLKQIAEHANTRIVCAASV
jgi:hypothetical protein